MIFFYLGCAVCWKEWMFKHILHVAGVGDNMNMGTIMENFGNINTTKIASEVSVPHSLGK